MIPTIFDIGATTTLPQVLGDYTGAPAWTILFDVFCDTGNYIDTWLRFRYQDATFDGWHLDVADHSWQSYAMTFDRDWSDLQVAANGWVDETAGTISWQQLMSNVFNPEIRLVLGDESSATAYIDNFALKAIPEPGTLGLLGAVLAALGVSSRRKRR